MDLVVYIGKSIPNWPELEVSRLDILIIDLTEERDIANSSSLDSEVEYTKSISRREGILIDTLGDI
jgi:hypothetical protein